MARETRESSFDELAIGLASGRISRRKALKLAGAALLGGILGSSTLLARVQAKEKACKVDAECPTGTTCIKKQCLTAEGCPPEYTLCADGLCHNLTTDPCNCGTCGNHCQGSMLGRCCVPDSEGKGTCTPPPEAGGQCPGPDPNFGGCPQGISPVKKV
jgi:hypothetical protein